MDKFKNLSLLLLILVGFTSFDYKQNEAQATQVTNQDVSIQTFLDDFSEAFNNTDIARIDELSASPFLFYVGGKLNKGNTYGSIVDFDAIKKSGWKYTKIDSSEIFYEDESSAQLKVDFTRYNDNDEAMVTSYVIWTLIKHNSNWKIKSAIILDKIPLAQEE